MWQNDATAGVSYVDIHAGPFATGFAFRSLLGRVWTSSNPSGLFELAIRSATSESKRPIFSSPPLSEWTDFALTFPVADPNEVYDTIRIYCGSAGNSIYYDGFKDISPSIFSFHPFQQDRY